MHLVLFDLDGTITQTYYGKDNSYMKALSRILPNVDVDYAYWKDCVNHTDSAVLNFIYQKLQNRLPKTEEIKEMQQQFLQELQVKKTVQPQFFQPISGSKEILTYLNQHPEYICGIATGGWRHIAAYKLNNIGLDINDFHFIGADDHESKADFVTALIQQIKSKTQKEITSISYVGDSLYDYKVSQTLSLNFIGVDFLKEHTFAAIDIKVIEHFQPTESFLDILQSN